MNESQESVQLLNDGKRRYITGFDGLRVLALLGVILYHLMPYSVQGGYLGVPIFFAVSGYLITDLFIQEWDRTGKIKIGSFFIRRIKRLYPTLIVVLLASTAYMTLFARNLLGQIRSVIWTNLVFVYNWWEVGHGQSYFDRYNGESPFTHLWYLSVLVQYYFIWPFVMVILLKFLKKRQRSALLLFVLAIASAILMAVLFSPNNTNRVYYGTDTRMAPYLLGAALSFIWPSTRLSSVVDRTTRTIMNVIGAVTLVFMIVLTFGLSGTSALTYHGGMLIFSLLSVLMIAVVAHPAASWDKWLTNSFFKWLGSRSYAIYLYQFPVMIFYEQIVTNIAKHPILNPIIETAIILGISELSYRFIEIPLDKFDYKQTWTTIKSLFTGKGIGNKRFWAIPVVLVTAIAAFGATTAPANTAKKTDALQSKLAKNNKETDKKNAEVLKKQKENQKAAEKHKAEVKALKENKKVKLNKKEKVVAKDYGLQPSEVKIAEKIPVTGIGDSIMLDVSTDIQQVFPSAYISGKVGRQVWDAPDIVKSLKSQGNLSDNVLINLGTNSPITMQQIGDVVNDAGKNRHIYWVNVHVPTQAWEGSVNRTLAKAAKKYKNFTVIDWHDLSQNQPGWFGGDHVHPNEQGSKAFTKLVTQQLIKDAD